MFYNRKGDDLDLKGIYDGSAVFLFGGGRSITPRHIELSKRPGIISASINEGGHYVRPNIYMSTSGITMPYSVLNDPTILKFINERYADRPIYEDRGKGKAILQYPNVVAMKVKTTSFENFLNDGYIYQQDQTSGEFAKNSAITFINVLVKLGFRKIYLVGMDFYSSTNNCTYFYEREYINKISGDLINKVKATLKQLVDLKDIQIYNTNERSTLDFFKYISLEEAIERHEVHYTHDIYDEFNRDRVVWGWKEYMGVDKKHLLKK